MATLHRHAAVCLALLLAAAAACAHGDWPPKHGGQMNDGGETSFELVARGRDVVFYVEDHGTPVPTQGTKGVLTVTRGERVWLSDIRAASGNRLSSRLVQPLAAGDRVLARVTLANGSIAAGRFVVR
jgi:hypothetical protein